MANDPWVGQGTAYQRGMQVDTSTGVISGATEFIDPKNFAWIDWFVEVTNAAGAATITFTPKAQFGIPITTNDYTLPYEPAVAGSGATTVYPYTFLYTIALGARQVFRTPAMGIAMRLTWTLDAGTADVDIWALPRI